MVEYLNNVYSRYPLEGMYSRYALKACDPSMIVPGIDEGRQPASDVASTSYKNSQKKTLRLIKYA